MATQLLPQSFWFRLAVSCPRIDSIPRENTNTGLFELAEACELPDISNLETGKKSWAQVKVAWNSNGLAISVQAESKPIDRQLAAKQSDGFAEIQLFIDTRDTRNVSRATRFCHRFSAKLSLLRDKSVDVEVAQRPIARAIADAPINRPETFQAMAELSSEGWLLDWFIPAKALNGFDPETNRRLGFAFQILDQQHDQISFPVGREFPVGENPGLWSTLELVD